MLRHADLLRAFASLGGNGLHRGGQAIGVELARQQVVDGHALRRDLAARHARHKARQATARAVGQTQHINRRLHSAGGDVDHAPKAPCGHAIHRGLDQLNGCEHVGVYRLDPRVAIPIAEVAWRGATGVGHDDIEVAAWATRSGKHRGAAFGGGDVSSYGHDGRL